MLIRSLSGNGSLLERKRETGIQHGREDADNRQSHCRAVRKRPRQ